MSLENKKENEPLPEQQHIGEASATELFAAGMEAGVEDSLSESAEQDHVDEYASPELGAFELFARSTEKGLRKSRPSDRVSAELLIAQKKERLDLDQQWRVGSYELPADTAETVFSHERGAFWEGDFVQSGQAGPGLTYREHVKSSCREGVTAVHSDLVFTDTTTGRSVNMASLFPESYHLVPARIADSMDPSVQEKAKRAPGKVAAKLYEKFRSAVQKYHGTSNTAPDARFSADEKPKMSEYGDVTVKGRRFYILHEAAHAWQEELGQTGGSKNFKSFYKNAFLGLLVGKVAKVLPAYVNENRQRDLTRLGIEEVGHTDADDPDAIAMNYEFPWPFYKKLGLSTTFKYMVKSKRALELTADFAAEERDASARAIMVLRYLRKQGIDLEPELVSADDFKNVVHGALATYQVGIGKTLVPNTPVRGKHGKQFTNHQPSIDEVLKKLNKIKPT